MKNALIKAAIVAVVILLVWEAKGQVHPRRHDPMYCPTDADQTGMPGVRLSVPCRDADRIRRTELAI